MEHCEWKRKIYLKHANVINSGLFVLEKHGKNLIFFRINFDTMFFRQANQPFQLNGLHFWMHEQHVL